MEKETGFIPKEAQPKKEMLPTSKPFWEHVSEAVNAPVKKDESGDPTLEQRLSIARRELAGNLDLASDSALVAEADTLASMITELRETSDYEKDLNEDSRERFDKVGALLDGFLEVVKDKASAEVNAELAKLKAGRAPTTKAMADQTPKWLENNIQNWIQKDKKEKVA